MNTKEMDIRRFFSPSGGTKKLTPSETSKVVAPDRGSKDSKTKSVRASKDKEKKATLKEKKDSQKKGRRRLVVLDDSDLDEDPIPTKQSLKASKTETVIDSDSDDASKRPSKSRTPSPKKSKVASPRKLPKKSTEKANGKETASKMTRITADEFFAESPVTVASKLSKFAAAAKMKSHVKEEHGDKEFEKTLDQLDQAEQTRAGAMTALRKRAAPDDADSSHKADRKTPKTGPSPKKQPKQDAESKEREILISRTPKKEIPISRTPKKESSASEGQPAKQTKRRSDSKVEVSFDKKTPTKPSTQEPKPEPKDTKPASAGKRGGGGGASYRSYLDREGPRLLGTREIPEGSPGSLSGITIVITGVLECIERDDAKALLESCGAKVTASVSRKTTYLVAARDSGPAKIQKAQDCKVEILDEDGLYNLIETKSGKAAKEPSPEALQEDDAVPTTKSTPKKRKAEVHPEPQPPEKKERVTTNEDKEVRFVSEESSTSKAPVTSSQGTATLVHEMWVDKYKPKTTKQIIGQQGDKSNCRKLAVWLQDWHKNRAGPKKPPPKWGSSASGDGSSFKATLLSGAPGVGKTTTATLVCKEGGFETLELNASDTRSKKSLKQEVAELLANQTLTGRGTTPKHVLIMDEVDGMAGNEDRGGVQELIALIKSTKIPIICICNDRSHPKMRSLVNHCFDLRFYRPQVKQIQAAMLSVACKEGLKIAPAAVQEIIVASNQDVRQALHNLSLWCAKTKGLTQEQAKADAGRGTKDIKLGPFDVVKKILCSSEGGQKMNLIEKSALFFHDYSMVPMFVQDNYVHVQPLEAKGDIKKHLHLLSETADSICQGDLIEKQIRSCGTWGLLPMQAIFSSVIPGELMRGYMREMINFPAWFGKNSSTGKRQRLLQELYLHLHTRVSGDRTQLNMDYLAPLRSALVGPLIDRGSEGVAEVVDTMNDYYLQRADLDTIVELSLWSGMKDPMTQVNPKVKAALTRALNKEGCKTPYAIEDIIKKKGKKGAAAKTPQSSEDADAEEDYAEEEGPDLADVDYD